MSQTYLLFQTLLLLFCPHSCMIWTKLTRTNDVFSRAICMVLLCAGKWIFMYIIKYQEKSQKIHAPEGPLCQKWGQRAARGLQAPCWRGPTPVRAGRPPGGVPPPLVPYLGSYFFPWRENPRTEVVFPVSIAELPPSSVLLQE